VTGIHVRIVNPWCAIVSGHGSRALIEGLRGRPPTWSTLSRGWVVQAHTARDVIAVAEARRWTVTVEDTTDHERGPDTDAPAEDHHADTTEPADQGVLW